MKLSLGPLAALTCSALFLVAGCGASASDTDAPFPGGSEDELRSSNLGAGVVAVRIAKTERGVEKEVVVVGQPSKVKSIVGAIGEPSGPVCGSMKGLSLTLLDAAGAEKVRIDTACGQGEAKKGGATRPVALDLAKIDAVLSAPTTLGDRFWGPKKPNRVELTRTVPPRTEKARLTGAREIEELLEGATLLPAGLHVEPPRCAYTEPHYGATLSVGGEEIGSLGASCGAGALTTTTAENGYQVEQVAIAAPVLKRLFDANKL